MSEFLESIVRQTDTIIDTIFDIDLLGETAICDHNNDGDYCL